MHRKLLVKSVIQKNTDISFIVANILMYYTNKTVNYSNISINQCFLIICWYLHEINTWNYF